MLQRFFKKVSRKAAQKDMENFLAYVQSGTDSEMAMMLCATGLARGFLRNTNTISRPFPELAFQGQVPVATDAEMCAELSLYILEINSVRKQIAASGNPRYELIGAGLGVFVQTIRALQHPELFALGRSFWKELKRGVEGFEEAVMAIKPDLDPSEVWSLMPIPNMLAPE